MEQKGILLSALGVGVGVGVGLGLASGHFRPVSLLPQTRVLLTSAAYVHLKRAEVSKFTRNLSPASRAILLSGPAENYQQLLAKALAHYFQAKLLLLDVTDFSLKIQSKYGTGNNLSVSVA